MCLMAETCNFMMKKPLSGLMMGDSSDRLWRVEG
jgi:hypothetical protein